MVGTSILGSWNSHWWYVSSNSQDSQWQKHDINTPPPPSETTKPSIPMSRPVSAAGRTSSSPATWTSGAWRRYEKPTAQWNPGMCWWPSMVDLQRTPKPGCKFPGAPLGHGMKQVGFHNMGKMGYIWTIWIYRGENESLCYIYSVADTELPHVIWGDVEMGCNVNSAARGREL